MRLLVLAAAVSAMAGGAAAAPENPAARYDRCMALARTKPREALADATFWREAGGGFPAQHCAAVALIGLKRYTEAATRLEALAGAMMQADPAMRAMALEQAGQAWLLQGDAARAKAALDAALQLKPGDPDLLIDRAQAAAEADRFGAAVEDLDRALAVAPQRADALIYRASAYRRLGRLGRASADVERALQLAPKAAAGYLERGSIRRLEGDLAGARADWRRVGTLAPGTEAAAAAQANLARLDAAPPPAPAQRPPHSKG